MITSLPFAALGVSAQRVLFRLCEEHMAHGGQENGRLVATYRQLAVWGVTRADISKGLAELQAAGWVKLTKQGLRVAGGGDPAEYALTWLPTGIGTKEGTPPTDAWRGVQVEMRKDGADTPPKARKWLAERLTITTRSARKRAPARDIRGEPQVSVGRCLK